MIVCVCFVISDRTLLDCAAKRMTFSDVQFELGVATQCGKCHTMACSFFPQEPDPPADGFLIRTAENHPFR